MEDALIKLLNNSIRAIKLNTKKPSEVGAEFSKNHTRLKALNLGMADDKMDEYKKAVENWKRQNENKTEKN